MTESKNAKDGASVSDEHPDLREINCWFLYGPKNGDIEELVRELTLVRGLRLSEVEDLILAALEGRRQSFLADVTQP